jgi:hypothetical protein
MSSIGGICPKEPTNNRVKVFLNWFLNTQRLKAKSLLTTPSNVLPLQLKQTFLSII